MVWFWTRDNQTLQVETRYDNDTSEFVVTVRSLDGQQRTERFRELAAFQIRIVALERQLEAQNWTVRTENVVLPATIEVAAVRGYAVYPMMAVFVSLLLTLRRSLRSRAALQIEVLALRHQLRVLERTRPHRLRLIRADPLLWVWLSRAWTDWRGALVIVKPNTVIAWHRQGSPPVLDMEQSSANVRRLIREMSAENPLWGAPRIHGELLKLGMVVSQASVAKYMIRSRQHPPSQTWRTFLANHIDQIMAADFFVVPTATYRLLFVLVILAHERRRIVHVSVTDHPTAAWTLQQLRDAFPWFIGSVRRECLDHVIVLNAAGLRRVLTGYVEYYTRSRTHLALEKGAPTPRPVARPATGPIVAIPQVSGLHHRYERRAA